MKFLWLCLPLLLVACGSNNNVSNPVHSDTLNLKSLQIDPTQWEAKEGESLNLKINKIWSDGSQTHTTDKIIWQNSDDTIAKLEPTNLQLKALKAGTTTITAVSTQDSHISGKITITVQSPEQQPQQSVTPSNPDFRINQTNVDLFLGKQIQLTATQKATWSSENQNIVSINSEGLATATGVGEAIVTATSVNNPQQAVKIFFHVKVQPSIQKITFTSESFNLNLGEKTSLIAKIDGSGEYNPALQWSTEDNSVATVDENGLVSAVSEGKTLITATSVMDASKKATAVINVIKPIFINPANLIMRQAGNGKLSLMNGNAIHWKSDNPAIITLAPDGSFITGSTGGSTIITATDNNGKTYQTTVTIKNYWLNLIQNWRAINSTCTISIFPQENSNATIIAKLNGDCPDSVPLRVIMGDNTLIAEGKITSNQPFSYDFPPKANADVYIQIYRDGEFSEPTAHIYWSGIFN